MSELEIEDILDKLDEMLFEICSTESHYKEAYRNFFFLIGMLMGKSVTCANKERVDNEPG